MAGVAAQGSSTRGTRVAVLVAGVLCCLLAGLVTAGPAAAHASLVSSDPGQGARLEAAPGRISLTFSESVSLGAGYARVLDARGQRVDAGTASVDGGVLAVPLRTDLPDGGYLVTYRVISADSHPVSGTFSFVVGEGELVPTVLLGAAGVSRAWVSQRLGVRGNRRRRTITAHAFAAVGSGAPPAERTPAAAPAPARAEEAARQLPSLRRSVLAEVVVAVVVLALSAVLVGTPPARSVLAQPVDVVLPLVGSAGSPGEIEVSVAPARPGLNMLHVYVYDDAGRLTQPAAIEVDLAEPAQGLGPIDVDLAPAGPGHYVGDAMAIPGAGTWTLTVRIRIDEFAAATASTVALGGPASAHVSVSSSDAVPGGYGKITFRVPNESDTASRSPATSRWSSSGRPRPV